MSKSHDIAFLFAGAGRPGSKHGFARRAVLETVLLDHAAFNVMFEQDIARRVARRPDWGNDVILELRERSRVFAVRAAATAGLLFGSLLSLGTEVYSSTSRFLGASEAAALPHAKT